MAEAEAVLVTALTAALTGKRICTELPATISGDTVRVTRISGTDGGQFSTYEDATVDFDCFSTTRAGASALAYSVRDYLRNTLPGTKVGTHAFIVRVRSINGPAWLPYDNTDVRRFIYTAQVRIHTI
jgi:hypothetical protein